VTVFEKHNEGKKSLTGGVPPSYSGDLGKRGNNRYGKDIRAKGINASDVSTIVKEGHLGKKHFTSCV